MAPNICRKAQKCIRPFFGGHTNNKSSCSLWEKICGQKEDKNFSGKFGEFGQKSFAPPKLCLLLHLWLVVITQNLLYFLQDHCELETPNVTTHPRSGESRGGDRPSLKPGKNFAHHNFAQFGKQHIKTNSE